jgi:hypothetical protein
MGEYTGHATKAITPTQEAFAEWILAEVFDGNLPKGLNKESFNRAIALGGSLRSQFQKSEWWKADSRNYLANVDARRETKAREALERAEERAKRDAARIEAARAKLAELEAKRAPEAKAEDKPAA